MAFQPANEYDIALSRRVSLIVQVVQGVLGAFLLMNAVQGFTHLLLLAVLLITLPLVHGGKQSGVCRGIARVFTTIPLAAFAVFVVEITMCWGEELAMQDYWRTLCVMGGLLLSYLSVGTTYAGIHGKLYDKIVACFTATWLAAIALLATFNRTVTYNIVWSWDNDIVRYVWVFFTVAAAILTWVCAFLPHSRQK